MKAALSYSKISLVCIHMDIMNIASLSLDEGTLDHAVCAIGFLFSECFKHNVNPFDFSHAIDDAPISEELKAILSQFYDHIVYVDGLVLFTEHHHEKDETVGRESRSELF